MKLLIALTLATLPGLGWAECPVVFAKDADAAGPAMAEKGCSGFVNSSNVSSSIPYPVPTIKPVAYYTRSELAFEKPSMSPTLSLAYVVPPYNPQDSRRIPDRVTLVGYECSTVGKTTTCILPAIRIKQVCTPETCGVVLTPKPSTGRQ